MDAGVEAQNSCTAPVFSQLQDSLTDPNCARRDCNLKAHLRTLYELSSIETSYPDPKP